MRYLTFFLFFVTVTILSSCLDTEEKISLNADNSGTYSLAYDLGRILEMAGSMGGADSNPDKEKQKQDTTIFFKDLLQETSVLTPEEKVLFADAQVTIKIDEEKSEMSILMSAPFKNAAGLSALKEQFPQMLAKLKAFEKATGEMMPEDATEDLNLDDKSTNPVGDYFTFNSQPGVISYSLGDMSAFKAAIAADSSLTMMSQMASMMGDFNYRTIFVLPKAVKTYEGPGSTVSPDKKTITFLTNLTEMMEQPEKASYRITW